MPRFRATWADPTDPSNSPYIDVEAADAEAAREEAGEIAQSYPDHVAPVPTAIERTPVDAERARRFEAVLVAADEAFWAAVAAAYPETRTGNFSPEATIAFTAASRAAVRSWLRWNLEEALPTEAP